MQTSPDMSDEEFQEFLKSIPTDKASPFGNRYEYLVKEGVTEGDIDLWNSLGNDEQQKIKEKEKLGSNKLIFMWNQDSGFSPDDCIIKLYKESRVFEDYPYAIQTITELKRLGFSTEDDYPLPWELFRRVKKYDELMFKDTKRFMETQDMVSSTTSGNDAIRQLIQNGII